MQLSASDILPADARSACLVGRVWVDGFQPGPRVCVVRGPDLIDLSAMAATLSHLFDLPDPAARVRAHAGGPLMRLDDAITEGRRWPPATCRPSRPPASPSPTAWSSG